MGESMFSFKRKKSEVSSDVLDSLSVNYTEKCFKVYDDFVKANQKNCKSSAIFLITGKTIRVDVDGRMELEEMDMVKVYNRNDELESIFPMRAIVCVEHWF